MIQFSNKIKGFTLIELLVVISIIGVISSIVFVSFSGSREKARLAKAQNFDAQVSHALGAYAVGIWRFEEGSGIDILDESGYGNDGTFVGNPSPTFPDSEVYPGTKALYFDGTDDYVDCGNGSSLNITDAITIEAWVKPESFKWGGTSYYNQMIVYADDNSSGGNESQFAIFFNNKKNYGSLPSAFDGKNIGFGIRTTTQSHRNRPIVIADGSIWAEYIQGCAIKNDYSGYTLGDWIHIVGIYDGTNTKLYLNGALEATSDSQPDGVDRTVTGSLNPSPITRKISHARFNGSIDNVSIYNEALSSAQIQQHYVMGAPSHGIAVSQ